MSHDHSLFIYSFQDLLDCFEGNTTEEQQSDMMTCIFFFVFVFHAVLFYNNPPHLGGKYSALFYAIKIKPSIVRFGNFFVLCDSLKCKMVFCMLSNSWSTWN